MILFLTASSGRGAGNPLGEIRVGGSETDFLENGCNNSDGSGGVW